MTRPLLLLRNLPGTYGSFPPSVLPSDDLGTKAENTAEGRGALSALHLYPAQEALFLESGAHPPLNPDLTSQ